MQTLHRSRDRIRADIVTRAIAATVLTVAMSGGAAIAQNFSFPTILNVSGEQPAFVESLPLPSAIDTLSLQDSQAVSGTTPPGDLSPEVIPGQAISRPAWYTVDYWTCGPPWTTSIELGVNGTQGTNDVFTIRAGGSLDRKTEWNKLDLDLVYNKASSNGLETQNNAQLDMRHDWLLSDSPWTIFVATGLLYDEYQAFDLRVNANGGIGYQFVDWEFTSLIGRFGAGTSREFGGPDNRWVPEALFGLEWDHAINERQKLYAKVDYFPDWSDFSSYRLVTDLGWEILVSEPSNLSLKLSVNERYDSTPNGADPSLLNYSALLLWKL